MLGIIDRPFLVSGLESGLSSFHFVATVERVCSTNSSGQLSPGGFSEWGSLWVFEEGPRERLCSEASGTAHRTSFLVDGSEGGLLELLVNARADFERPFSWESFGC